jgi:hypothetical protein
VQLLGGRGEAAGVAQRRETAQMTPFDHE